MKTIKQPVNDEGSAGSRLQPGAVQLPEMESRRKHVPHSIELRAGDGGDEAYQFAKELAGSFARWLRSEGADVKELPNRGRGLIELRVVGDPESMSGFVGVHRVQRQSGGTKRHSSTVTVALMQTTEVHAFLADKDLRMEFFRGQGPGGQHRNTSEQAVRLYHRPTGMVVEIDGRSRVANIKAARAELLQRLQRQATAAGKAREHAGRSAQIGLPNRSGKDFTHNWQRGEVLNHNTGQRWRLRDFQKGRLGRRSR